MKTNRWRPSLISLAVAAVLVGVSVGGYFFLQHSVDQQENALLQSQTTDAGTTAASFFGEITSPLSNDATILGRLASASPATFETVFETLSKTGVAPNLVSKTGDNYVVVVAGSKGFSTGQVLSGPALATLQKVKGSGVVTGPVTSNGKLSYGRFAAGVSGDLYLYAQFAIPPHIDIASALGSSAYSSLNVALYGPGPISPQNLLVTSTRELPLTGNVAHTSIKVGASTWTLVATARSPFVSGLASSGPLVLLILGLFIALIVAMTVEVVQRRHRYAQELVDERTADLHTSMQELRDAQDALVRSERLTAVGEMASVIGHELRNPLAAVTNSLFIVRNDLGQDVSPMTEKYLSLAERETSKAATLADDLTAFVRPREMKTSEMQLSDLFSEVLAATPHPDNVDVMVDVGAVDLVGDRNQLAEVLTNLVTNAYQAMPDGGALRLTGSSDPDAVTIVVEDSGAGVDQATMGHVFEPFFTTKASGTGLGLAIVQRLVQAHHGEIAITNVAGGGVRVTVVLPGVPERVREEARA